MTEHDKLHLAYSLNSPLDRRRLYAGWARTYEADLVRDKAYILHRHVVRAFVAAGARARAGYGRGHRDMWRGLAEAGVQAIEGADISPEMLAQAKTKDIYQRLFEGDILTGLDVPDDAYRGIVSAGTFTLGHVGADGLDEVVRCLGPGGLAVISVRDQHFYEAGFADKIEELAPFLSNVGQSKARIYADGAQGRHAQDRAIFAASVESLGSAAFNVSGPS